jgi:3-oxoacyl-[acyl-carrier-protein] synthase III
LKKRRAVISAVGMYVPERVVTNQEFAERVDTSDEWIRERTGIRERRAVSDGECNSDLSVAAVRNCLASSRWGPEDIDLIIVSTVTPDMLFPSTACVTQQKLGARNAWGFDLSGACSGFLYALATGAQFIETGAHRRVLVVGADVMTSIVDPLDRATCVLFGDGAGAALLEASEDEDVGILDFILKGDGAGGRFLYMPAGGSLKPASHETVEKRLHYVHQDGRAVFKFAVTYMADVSTEILRRNGFSAKDLRLFVPHQANLRIIKSTADRLGLCDDQVAVNIERYANTTAATIPICLYENQMQGKLRKGDLVLLTSFGAGFTWGSVLLRWGMGDARQD